MRPAEHLAKIYEMCAESVATATDEELLSESADRQGSVCQARSQQAGEEDSHCEHWWDGGACCSCGAQGEREENC